jgi:hypothetical protein
MTFTTPGLLRLAGALVLAAAVAAGCGGGSSTQASTPSATTLTHTGTASATSTSPASLATPTDVVNAINAGGLGCAGSRTESLPSPAGRADIAICTTVEGQVRVYVFKTQAGVTYLNRLFTSIACTKSASGAKRTVYIVEHGLWVAQVPSAAAQREVAQATGGAPRTDTC